jgi:DNA repair exonuclease SbcCD ATPase subunit
LTFIISGLTSEGVRGINSKFEHEFSDGLTILLGSNGTGKTTVLQAIEWCLTGKLSYLQGPDFRKEDAIVNLYHMKKRAHVSAMVSDGKTKIMVTRTRKMAKSTTVGSSPVEVKHGGTVLNDEDAEKFLEKNVTIGLEYFPRAIYLHQEAIRDLVSEDPAERSEAIDRLLGTAEIRELVDLVDAKRSISSEVKALEDRAKSLERDKIQFAVGMRNRLSESKTRLLEKGHGEDHLSPEHLVQAMRHLFSDLDSLAKNRGLEPVAFESFEASVASLSSAILSFETSIQSLDRGRITALQRIQREKVNLENAKNEFNRAEAEVRRFGSLTLEKIQGEKKQLEDEVKNLNTINKRLQAAIATLSTAQARIQSLDQEISSLGRDIHDSESKYGNEDGHKSWLADQRARLQSIRDEASRHSVLDQIVSLGINYLEENKPESCPICAQSIDHAAVVKRLQTEINTSMKDAANRLEQQKASLSQQIVDVQSSLSKLQTTRISLVNSQKSKTEILKNAEAKLGGPIDEDVPKRLEDATNEVQQLSAKLVDYSKRLEETDRTYREMSSSIKKLEDWRSILDKAVGTIASGAELIRNAETRLSDLESDSEKLQETKEIDALSGRGSKANEIIQYLKDEEEVRQIEEELPSIAKLVADLRGRVNSLKQLEGSLAAIRQVASQYQKEAVLNEVESLEKLLNKYYASLVGHPSFPKLKLSIEKEEPLLYSIKATGHDHSTYIPTRFSTAQVNVVALSLFLSNHDKLASGLRTLILDDPTQNLDLGHKKNLATVIAGLASNHQVLLSTPDEDFKDMLRSACPEAKVMQFGEWTSEGPSVLR